MAQLARSLIGTFGWREAYAGLGITIFVVAFFPIAIFLREPESVPAVSSTPSKATAETRAVAGPMAAEVLRTSRQFWLLAAAFFLVVVTVNGPLIHAVALLTDRGISIQMATAALSAAGLAMILGRMLAGYALDKFFGPYVAIVSIVGAMIGVGLLISPAKGLAPIAGTVLCGLGMGAEGDIVPYFVSRYFGLRAFGQIYGYLFAVFMVGVGVGPSLLGFSFDRWHSYTPMLVIFEIALFLACLMFLRLGPYRFRIDDQPAHRDEGQPASASSSSTIRGAARL